MRPRHGVDLAALARQVPDGWAGAGFTSTQGDVWVGRPDGVPVPDITGIEAAAPLLIAALGYLGPPVPLRVALTAMASAPPHRM
ncbi:MAG: hypothetical protein P8Y27_13650 [Chromatiaceae bacterium]